MLLGTAIVLALLARSAALNPPGGEGEKTMWLQIYAAIWGAPTSLITALVLMVLSPQTPPILVRALLLLSVIVNWTLIGTTIGAITGRVRRRHSHPSPHGGVNEAGEYSL